MTSRGTGPPDRAALLFERNVGLVHMVVRELRGQATASFDVDDMRQEGMLGLLYAARNWDEARGYRFSTYAVPCIRGAIRSAWAAKAATVRVPAGRRAVAVVTLSLDLPAHDEPAGGTTLGDMLADPDAVDPADSAATGDLDRRLGDRLAQLEPTHRAVLVLRYGLDGSPPRTPALAADRLGMTAAKTRKLEAEALVRLREELVPPTSW